MRLVDNRGVTDPRLNLALEEFVFRNYCEGEYLLLYINEPSVIVGKHQNVLEEVDLEYAEARAIPVIRRVSGGGAVYHDRGNLNFSVITDHDPKKHNNYDSFLAPVIEALRELAVESGLNNRNSLVLSDGRKISGNAQFASRGRMLSHGTLLFNSDLDALNAVLLPTGERIESHAVQSVRSRVVNLTEVIGDTMSISDFADLIARYFIRAETSDVTDSRLQLSSDEWHEVQKLAREKYDTWEWNIGRSPKFSIRHRGVKGESEFEICVRVVDGIVESIEIERGDDASVAAVESLKGRRYEPKRMRALINTIENDRRDV